MIRTRTSGPGIAVLAALTIAVITGCAVRGSPPGASANGAATSPGVSASGGAGGTQGRSGAGGSQGAPAGFGSIAVLAAIARVGPLTAGNSTAATVAPIMTSTVASQVAGVVATVSHLAGDWVRKGDPVVLLDTSQLKLAVDNAQASLASAKIAYAVAQDSTSQDDPKLTLQVQSAQSAVDSAQKNYDSQKALLDLGGTPASSVDQALSQLQQAQANLKAAQTALEQNKKSDVWTLQQSRLAIDQAQVQLETVELNLQNASISAPFGGQIAAVTVNPGMYVSQNTPVFTIVTEGKEITFSIPPADAPNLPVGTSVGFSYQGSTWAVKVSQAPVAPLNGVVPMVAAVPSSFPVPYGAVGTVTYSLTVAHGAVVPIAALQTAEDQTYVFTIQNGKAAVSNVTIVGQSGTMAAVSGIPDGSQLIVSPPPGLLAGSAVQVNAAAAAAPSSAPSAGGGAPLLAAAPGAGASK